MATADDQRPFKEDILGDLVDVNTFEQILEMDEPGDQEFSKSIVFGFFDQAEETFTSMDEALDSEDLQKLSELGHFLKGSSATLGLVKVREGCEKIERYGKMEDGDGNKEDGDGKELDTDACLKNIKVALKDVKKQYQDVERALRRFYDDREEA